MRCRIYGPDENPPIYGRGTRVRFKETTTAGLRVLNQSVRCTVDRGSMGTIVSVFPSTIIDVDSTGGDGATTLMRVTVAHSGRLKDLLEIINGKPELRVVK